MNRATEALCRRATALICEGLPLPLDLFAALNEAGVNVEELERFALRGEQLCLDLDAA